MRSNTSLSPRQESILNYIQQFISDHGYSPSIRDIQMNLKISSTSVVAYNLKALQEKGKLNREGKISRGIKLPGMRSVEDLAAGVGFQVPLLGVITAGTPLPNPEDTSTNTTEMVEVPPALGVSDRLNDVYALRVRGQSMIDALIDDGDIVLMRYQETAENGQMVAAMLVNDNAVTLKRFYHEGERIRLQPANSTMSPIYTPPDNVLIRGRVVGVIRSLM
ncbi:MAG: transcriptional repressor LexA [Chloroflexaceae bacterium]|nr:transcriptional repressor LexA [Chloroflexaceae bacterium]